jgi:flagellar hook assembly protein FlgD
MGSTSVGSAVVPSMNVLKAYPNPFVETATFEVNTAEGSNVMIEVMDYTGKKVAELNNSQLSAGTHKFEWNGANVASGLYFARITSGNDVQIVKIQKMNK